MSPRHGIVASLAGAGLVTALAVGPVDATSDLPGITVNHDGAITATYDRLGCRTYKSHGTTHFAAYGQIGHWELEVHLNKFKGYGKDYELDYGDYTNNVLVTPPSRDRSYSNTHQPAFPISHDGGGVEFKQDAKRVIIGVSFLAAFSEQGAEDGSDAVEVDGRAYCAFPRKK